MNNDNSDIKALKIALYDVIEQQALAQNEFNELEKKKAELAKQLGEARNAQKTAKVKPSEDE